MYHDHTIEHVNDHDHDQYFDSLPATFATNAEICIDNISVKVNNDMLILQVYIY